MEHLKQEKGNEMTELSCLFVWYCRTFYLPHKKC